MLGILLPVLMLDMVLWVVDENAFLAAAEDEHTFAGGAIHTVRALGYVYGNPYAGLGYAEQSCCPC